MTRSRRYLAAACCCAAAALLLPLPVVAAGPMPGYADYKAFEKQLDGLKQLDAVRVSKLVTTSTGRSVYLLTVGRGKVDAKPAILVVGSIEASHLLGSELAVRMARLLATPSTDDEAASRLLDRFTFYIVPRPNPDGSEKCFQKPYWEHHGNARKTDDDRDHEFGEDPPEDLNGDGVITMMRVRDETGEYMPDAKDPRVMIKADPKKNEHGRYRLLTEGIDNDGDEQFNEDPGDGVSLNRNFTFRYPYFQAGAGPHQVSEPESRALADFAFDHTNIALVFTFTPEDNLVQPWAEDPKLSRGAVREAIDAADVPYLALVAEKYRGLHAPKGVPRSPAGAGSFSEWAYYHYGRWSLAARGWWVPPQSETGSSGGQLASDQQPMVSSQPSTVSGQPSAKIKPDSANGPGTNQKAPQKTSSPSQLRKIPTKAAAKPGPRARGRRDEPAAQPETKPVTNSTAEEDRNALAWFKTRGIDGFVEWNPIKHRDFPDQQVEVGGFRPFVRLNPPAAELDSLATEHYKFLLEVSKLMPKLEVNRVKVDTLGAGVFRLKVTVANQGFLPTISKMGEVANQLQVLQAELKLPAGVTLVQGSRRRRLPRLEGNGAHTDVEWIVRAPAGKRESLGLHVYAPEVGDVTKQVELKP